MASGIPEEQAEALAGALSNAYLESVPTKGDLAELREQLRVEIRELKIDLLKWVIPLLLGQIAVFAALVQWIIP